MPRDVSDSVDTALVDTALVEDAIRPSTDSPTDRAAEAATFSDAGEPLVDPEAADAFLVRWNEIQIGFVEDPAKSVRAAGQLVDDIAHAYAKAFSERRAELDVSPRNGEPTTEELRLALRRYRAFLTVALPK